MFRRTFLALALAAAALAGTGNSPRVTAVDSIGLTVSDLDRSVELCSKVLTFEKVSEAELAGEEYEHLQGVFGLRIRTARMRLGGEFIELTGYLAPKGRPAPADTRSNDRWFQHVAIIVSDMDRAYRWLRQNKVQHASSGPQRLPDWNKNAGGIRAFYFRDPDGHALEVLAFPPDKGNPKWRRPGDRLFLGIDHTAIVVSDTEASLGFYRDVRGLEVAGESENYGPEQERLKTCSARVFVPRPCVPRPGRVSSFWNIWRRGTGALSAGGAVERPHPLANQRRPDCRAITHSEKPKENSNAVSPSLEFRAGGGNPGRRRRRGR